MDAFDWTSIVRSTEETKSLYATPPDLSNECDLFHVQIDERGTSVTLGFETSVLPSNPPITWTAGEYNTLEFYIRFTGVKGLQIAGWDSSARDAAVTLSPCGDAGVQVAVEGLGSHLVFTASTALLTRARAYLSTNTA
ncbi:Imm50 family immunity protein [Streptomyces sp. NPDC002825]|uniref:Imm50 family immunity protein n=1 Tax=Streptomyces sp. NPDC002825 TaxID=3154666 RepID=UPI0033185D30